MARTGPWVVCWVRNSLIFLMLNKVKQQNWETEAMWSQKSVHHQSWLQDVKQPWKEQEIGVNVNVNVVMNVFFAGTTSNLSRNKSEIHAGMSEKQFEILSETEGSSRRWQLDWGTVSETVMWPEELWMWMERCQQRMKSCSCEWSRGDGGSYCLQEGGWDGV